MKSPAIRVLMTTMVPPTVQLSLATMKPEDRKPVLEMLESVAAKSKKRYG